MNGEQAGIDEQLAAELGAVAAAVQATLPTEPSGEQEKRLRKPDASGTLVKMANGDVAYVPVLRYAGKFWLKPNGKPGTKFERASKYHAELESCLDRRMGLGPGEFDLDFFAELLYEVLRENYPALTVAEMSLWAGDIKDGNDTIAEIFAALDGVKKGVR